MSIVMSSEVETSLAIAFSARRDRKEQLEIPRLRSE
jgi:hypothetical protein